MTNEQKFLIQSLTQHLVSYVMRDRNVSMIEAFRIVYHSHLFELLCDTETGLYTQSPLYLYQKL